MQLENRIEELSQSLQQISLTMQEVRAQSEQRDKDIAKVAADVAILSDNIKALIDNNKPNNASDNEMASTKNKAKKRVRSKAVMPILPPSSQFLEFLNEATMDDIKAHKAGIQVSPLQKLVDERKNGLFTSEEDLLVRLQGTGITRIVLNKLRNKWENPPSATTDTEAQAVTNVVADTTTATVASTSNPVTTTEPNEEREGIPNRSIEDTEAHDTEAAASSPTQVNDDITPAQPVALATHEVLKDELETKAVAHEVVETANAIVAVDSAQPQDKASAVVAENELDATDTTIQPTTTLLPSDQALQDSIDKFNNMDTQDLTVLLNRHKIGKKLIEVLIARRPFTSFDTITIPGFGPAKKETLKKVFLDLNNQDES